MALGGFSLPDIEASLEDIAIKSVVERTRDFQDLLSGYEYSLSVISLEGKIRFITSSSDFNYSWLDRKNYKEGMDRLSSQVDSTAFSECMLRRVSVSSYFKSYFEYLDPGYICYVFPLKNCMGNSSVCYIEIVIDKLPSSILNLNILENLFFELEIGFEKSLNNFFVLKDALFFCSQPWLGMSEGDYVLYNYEGRVLYFTKKARYLLRRHGFFFERIEDIEVDGCYGDDPKVTLSKLDILFKKEWAFSLDILGGPRIICVDIPEK